MRMRMSTSAPEFTITRTLNVRPLRRRSRHLLILSSQEPSLPFYWHNDHLTVQHKKTQP